MRYLILAHRWLGILLCLFFAAWFFSGAVLIYVPFPSLSSGERLSAFQTDVNPTLIQISPQEAQQAADVRQLKRLRLLNLDGRPVYVVRSSDNEVMVVGANDGKLVESLKQDTAAQIAQRFTGKSIRNIEPSIEYDQWVVYESFDPYRPFYRVELDDPESTALYISERTGEILQKTTAFQRGWNYVGAVVHWIYPTVLRKHWALWDQTVWWLSLFGIVAAIFGIWLGVIRYREAKGNGQVGMASPFIGWMRWHHILGLGVGGFVLTWIFSGWLSMDHQRLFSSPKPQADRIANFQGLPLYKAIENISAEAIKQIKPFREVEFKVVNGQAILLTRTQTETRLLTQEKSEKLTEIKLTKAGVVAAVNRAWSEANVKTSYQVEADDVYNQLREGSMPPNTLRVVLDWESEVWVHVDMETGRIVSVMDQSRRVYRWLFNGLHSLDFPGLANRRPLWDAVILFLLAFGFVFSLTGVVIGIKRLRG